MELPALLRRYGGLISTSAAYRAALAEGVRGKRRNNTRYEGFWRTINWVLPDSVLSNVWGVSRGNLRQRRVRLGVGDPAYDARFDFTKASFLDVVAFEVQRAAAYTGPRPR